MCQPTYRPRTGEGSQPSMKHSTDGWLTRMALTGTDAKATPDIFGHLRSRAACSSAAGSSRACGVVGLPCFALGLVLPLVERCTTLKCRLLPSDRIGQSSAKRSHSGAAAAPANGRGDAPGLARGTERHGLASRTPHFGRGAALYFAAMRPAHPHPAPREPTP